MTKLLSFKNRLKLFNIHGHSMLPVLENGDLVLAKSLLYSSSFRRGDIIVFTSIMYPNSFFVKRIIALPGDTFQINNLSDKITMNSDEFFVHGDNNLDSLDSNKLGPIKTDEIFGKVVFRLWPFNKIGIINSF